MRAAAIQEGMMMEARMTKKMKMAKRKMEKVRQERSVTSLLSKRSFE